MKTAFIILCSTFVGALLIYMEAPFWAGVLGFYVVAGPLMLLSELDEINTNK